MHMEPLYAGSEVLEEGIDYHIDIRGVLFSSFYFQDEPSPLSLAYCFLLSAKALYLQSTLHSIYYSCRVM